MNKKRTKLEVVKDILETLRKGKEVKITHLIYRANLSNNSIKPYIDHLLKNNLIELVKEKDKLFFVISQKGLGFLQEFDRIRTFSESYGLNEFF